MRGSSQLGPRNSTVLSSFFEHLEWRELASVGGARKLPRQLVVETEVVQGMSVWSKVVAQKMSCRVNRQLL
jgi:hypothetical protein